MKKVVVVMGGLSSEKEISLLSGKAVVKALKQKGYRVVGYTLKKDIKGLIEFLKKEKPDVVFNALHGKYGEDGCIQGILNLMHIPYTHSGVMASSIGMNKEMTRKLVSFAGVEVADGGLTDKATFLKKRVKIPYVIKPNAEGSSIGVEIVRTKADEQKALKQWKNGEIRLVEKYIAGREMSVAVLEGKAMGIVEIKPKKGYYDFKNKYTEGATEHIIPAEVSPKLEKILYQQAETAHRVLGCRGVSRSDFRVNGTQVVFLEINTNPGMTNLSLVPDIARKCQGLSYPDLVGKLVEEAECDA